MEKPLETLYVKRTQKDYSLSLKLQIVKEIEFGNLGITDSLKKYAIQSRSTVVNWLKKYGNFDWDNQIAMQKPPDQRIMELEAEVKLLQKQKALLERQVYIADKKAVFFDMMIDLAESEYQIDIRKNSASAQSATSAEQKKKR